MAITSVSLANFNNNNMVNFKGKNLKILNMKTLSADLPKEI